jgi:hypothetical protein
LLTEDSIQTLINLRDWLDVTPRVTKDFDFIAELDLIASLEHQDKIDGVLEANGFAVVPENARWQFRKEFSGGTVSVDFHSPPPREKRLDLRVSARRIKPPVSLKKGIHSRENPEAMGCHLHPFTFKLADTEVAVPNPLTWTIMKMAAMRDRWRESQRNDIIAEKQSLAFEQAEKHGQDVCRVLAMMTRDENDCTEEIKATLMGTASFQQARRIYAEFFHSDHAWGPRAMAAHWRAEDLSIIRQTLGHWFA